MAGFGIGTDHFGLAAAGFVLIESNNVPLPQTVEAAEDEDGNFAAEDQYDGAAAEAIECVYSLQSGTLNLNTLALGHLLNGATNTAVERVAVSTSNGDWPTVRVSGWNNVTDFTNWESWTLPSITISAKKQAQGLDFTVGADCRLQSSTWEAAGEIAYVLDNLGDVGAMGFSGARATMSADAVEITGAITWTPDASYIETQGPGANTGNITWAGGTMTAEKGLTPDP
jgi:hypothetical protein